MEGRESTVCERDRVRGREIVTECETGIEIVRKRQGQTDR